MKLTMIPIIIGALNTITNGLAKGLVDLEIGASSGDHPNYSIIKVCENTAKGPGDLRRLAVTQIPVEDNQLKLAWKTFKWV